MARICWNRPCKDCKDRCKTAFANMPSMLKACKNACVSDSGIDVSNFICDPKWGIPQQVVIREYGYDPCPGDTTTMEGVFDPLSIGATTDAQNESVNNYVIIGGIILIIALIVLYTIL